MLFLVLVCVCCDWFVACGCVVGGVCLVLCWGALLGLSGVHVCLRVCCSVMLCYGMLCHVLPCVLYCHVRFVL